MVFGITAMVFVGISWIIYGCVMGRAPRYGIYVPALLFVSALTALMISLCGGIIQGIPSVTAKGAAIAFASQIVCGIFNYLQLDLMSRAMQKGPNGIIWSVIQSGFIFPFLMGIIFFDVALTGLRISGFAAAILSLIFFGFCKSRECSGQWKLLMLGAFLATGCSQSMSNLPSYFPEAEAVSSIWRTAAFAAGMMAGGLIFEMKRRKEFFTALKTECLQKKFWICIFLLVAVEMLASYLLLFPGMDALVHAGAGAVAYPVMVCSCIVAFELYSFLILREKHKLLQYAAFALCLTGVVLLSIS